MKVAFIIGHTEKSKGAVNVLNGLKEFDYYKEVCKSLDFDVYEHDKNISGYTTRIKETASRVNKKDYDLVMSLHFNSFKGSANGCETLYYFNSNFGKRYAKLWNTFFSNKTKIKDRGIKALANKNDRGFAVLKYVNATTILIEPFFGSNINDCKKVDVCLMAELLNQFIELNKKPY